ncbi:MAG TPA: citrate synthase [Candidatus Deferrimicrobium sp.]|nr:citrate synthase [Candidatus Deferrimicrobium sp.]
MEKKATLIIEGQRIEFPIIEGTEGEKAIDIRQLRSKTGYITYDPGYANTGSCTSAITFIDGEKGILRYHGIPIEQFDRERPDFIEVAYLVIFGNLPTLRQLECFKNMLLANEHLHESMKHHFEGFPPYAPPMASLSAMINAMSCFHPELLKLDDKNSFQEASARLISKIRTIAAYSYRHARGLPLVYPMPDFQYCVNFLHMMFSLPNKIYKASEEIEDALNLIFILHADHEQNCSTATVRMVGSSQANLFASCASGVCALWGPLHGGANLAVIEMLEEIHKGKTSPAKCIEMAKDKNSKFRLMGFGHRVYKNYDPRARILKRYCDKILANLGKQDPLLDIARDLEGLALNDSYFIERKLYPNVDFYSGIILRAIGIPTDMFPVMFSIGRLPGWIAQWKEQLDMPDAKISRPRQIYIGETARDYIPIEQRG